MLYASHTSHRHGMCYLILVAFAHQCEFPSLRFLRHGICLISPFDRSDSTKRGWLGDAGRSCGYPWYPSNIIVGQEHYKPDCTWIDQDDTDGLYISGLQIHMEDFVVTDEDKKSHNGSYYCQEPAMVFKREHRLHWIFAWHQDFLASGDKNAVPAIWQEEDKQHENWTPPGGETSSDGGGRKRRRNLLGPRKFKHLVASPHDTHSAQQLCESATSHGPDFVSFSENIFCDMDTKEHWPLCKSDGDDHCYHWDTHSLVRYAKSTPREYSHVEHWE